MSASLPRSKKSRATAPSSSSQKNCGTRLRKEISSETKNRYIKALSIWLLFTLAGWVSISEELLPLFSHCVGFGFFLTITTRKTRWLGAIAVGGLVFTVLLYQTFPADWISVVTQSAGYVSLTVFFIIVALWRVAPPELRDDIARTTDDMLLRGSRYLEQIKVTLTSDHQVDGEGAGTHANLLLKGVDESKYKTIIERLDAKLMEMDKENASMRSAFNDTLTRLSQKLDNETSMRLRLEKGVQERDVKIGSMKEELATLRKKAETSLPAELKTKLSEERQLRARLHQNLEVEKGTRRMLQNDLVTIKSEKSKYEKLLRKMENDGQTSTHMIGRIRKTLEAKEEELQYYMQRCTRLKETFDRYRERTEERYEEEKKELETEKQILKQQLKDARLMLGIGTQSISTQEIQRVIELHEKALIQARERHAEAILTENQRLKAQNEQLQDKMLCRVCLSHESAIVLVPCGHLCMCKPCSGQVEACPICRQTIVSSHEIFVC